MKGLFGQAKNISGMKNQIYHVIEAALRNHVAVLPLDEAVTADDIRQAVRWVMRDNPDIFWFSHQYEYDSNEAVVRLQYTFSPERVARIRESIDDVVKNDFCLDKVCRLSPPEQVAYVYKWLVTYCSYNVNSAYNQTIYSVLVRRNSVCTGYAKTAQYLFGLLGLESRLVFGRLHHDREEGRHCWNMVRLEGEYYHFDACLADGCLESVVRNAGLQDLYQIDGINYNFLCVSTPEILLTRTIEDMDTLPDSHQSLPREVVGRLATVATGRREEIKDGVGESCTDRSENMVVCDRQADSFPDTLILAPDECCSDLVCDIQPDGTCDAEESVLPVIDADTDSWAIPSDDMIPVESDCMDLYGCIDFGSCSSALTDCEDNTCMQPYIVGAKEQGKSDMAAYLSQEQLLDGALPCFPDSAANEGVTYSPHYEAKTCTAQFCKDKEGLFRQIQSLEQKRYMTEGRYMAEKKLLKENIASVEADVLSGDFEGAIFSVPPSGVLGHILRHLISRRRSENNPDRIKKDKERQKLKELQAGLQTLEESHARFLAEVQSQIDDCQHKIAAIEEQEQYTEVYSSVFAPAEVKRRSNLMVQVYLHLFEESENIKTMASETDRNATRRDYNALDMKLKSGDKVDVAFSVHGETCLVRDRKSVVWNGSFRKCTFNCFVPEDLDVEELRCELQYYVNGTLIGDSQFTTQIVTGTPRILHSRILSEKYHKIFISYAHLDYDKVKFMAAAYRAQGVDYFFDRDYLKAGDIYPEKIKEYINTCDLFVLCWSSNAAKSEYVQLEKAQALPLAKNTDEVHGTLTIHPLSLKPEAALPDDMKETYNFEKI